MSLQTQGQLDVDPHDTPLAAVVPLRIPGEVVPVWEAALPGFCRSLALALSEGTCRTYLEALARFLRHVGDPMEADAAAVEGFLARPRERAGAQPRPRAASTRVVELAALRRYYAWARREHLRDDDPTDGIRLRRPQAYADLRVLGADQARDLLATLPADDVDTARLRCLCLWYLLSGRRRVEILRLRWSDLDFENGTYTYTRKGGRREMRPLLPVLRDATLAYARLRKVGRIPDHPIFPGRDVTVPLAPRHVTRLLAEALRHAGIADVPRPVHALRHSYARLLREVGASVEDVQRSLDHASLATTDTYLRRLEGSDDPFGPRLAALLLGPALTPAPHRSPPPREPDPAP